MSPELPHLRAYFGSFEGSQEFFVALELELLASIPLSGVSHRFSALLSDE